VVLIDHSLFLISVVMSKKYNLVTVHIVQSPIEAEIIKGRLEYEGIPVILKYESAGRVIGITVDGLGQIEIQVHEPDVEKAEEILSRDENSYPKQPDR
jgi:hypothetical protein